MSILIKPSSISNATTAAAKTLSHLLIAGNNCLSPPSEYASRSQQAPSNAILTVIPFALWLGSIGRANDVDAGWHLSRSGLGAGFGHTIITYTSGTAGVDRIFAAGRNESGQLGIGYNSQEGTRNLIQGFNGEGIVQTAAGLQSSYILVKHQEGTSLFVAGNQSRGRLSQPTIADDLIPDDYIPSIQQLTQATIVHLPEGTGTIKEMAVGFEHALLLSESGEIYGTGANTDGQCGLGPECLADVKQFRKLPLPAEIQAVQGGVARIRAGADTSALITKAGKVWTWGNSEYGQALHGRKIDQITTPQQIDSSFLPPSRRIVDFRCGGSFSIVLDNKGSVYAAGFGALGLGREHLESQLVRRIDALEGKGITRIRAGYGAAIAIRDDGDDTALYSWGLNNHDGKLGVGSLTTSPIPSAAAIESSYGPSDKRSLRGIRDSTISRIPMQIYEPIEMIMPLGELGLGDGKGPRWRLGEVEMGEETTWVEILQEVV